MRHAKSDWSGSGTSDFDRPINNRGQENAMRVGQWMAANNHFPEEIISSPARRARQSIELVSKQLKFSQSKIKYDESLYLASFDTLMECVQLYKDNVSSLMLVAHNPGLEYLINFLLSKSVNQTSTSISVTTANLAIFEYEDESFDAEVDKCNLKEFIKPKELG